MHSVESFESRWHSRCTEIKAQSFSRAQCALLQRQLKLELGCWQVLNGSQMSVVDLLALQTDLRLALAIAYSSYRKQGNWFTKLLKSVRWGDSVLKKNEL